MIRTFFFFVYNVITISLFQLDSQQSKTQCQIDKQRGFSQIYFDLNEDQQDNNGGENVNQADSDPQKGGSVKNEQKGTIKTTFHPKMELAENNLQKIANQTKRTCHRKKCLKESKGSTHGQS